MTVQARRSVLPNPPTGSGPNVVSTSGSFNVSQRRELGRREADRPGMTSSGTEGKTLGCEKFNGERPERACW